MVSQEISSLWDRLLTDMPDDVALDEIATKFTAHDVRTLASVSPRWREQIQRRVVYDARVRCHSLETHVVLEVDNGLCLYSLSNQTTLQLPRIPVLRFGYQFITLDGKLYVLGGEVHPSIARSMNPEAVSRKVFVLDLAGEMQWMECASMLHSRQKFGCGVLAGKIYAFGGDSVNFVYSDPEGASEVYDPEVDLWFPRKAMLPMIMGEKVSVVGEELFVHGLTHESPFQAYHPGDDEWRVVILNGFGRCRFYFQGDFYGLFEEGIYTCVSRRALLRDGRSRAYRCAVRCDELGRVDALVIATKFIIPVNNELLANVSWRRKDNPTNGQCLLLSSGFGSGDQDVVWRKVADSCEHQSWKSPMCLVEL